MRLEHGKYVDEQKVTRRHIYGKDRPLVEAVTRTLAADDRFSWDGIIEREEGEWTTSFHFPTCLSDEFRALYRLAKTQGGEDELLLQDLVALAEKQGYEVTIHPPQEINAYRKRVSFEKQGSYYFIVDVLWEGHARRLTQIAKTYGLI